MLLLDVYGRIKLMLGS